MANLGQWYSGNNYGWNDGDAGYFIRAMVKVDLISQDPASNTSVVRYTSAVSHHLDGWKLSHTLYDVCAGVVLYNSPFTMDFPDSFGPNPVRWNCIVRDRTISHDANGNASFNVSHQWGPTSVSASYTLPKINRQATITSVDDFVVGNTTAIYFSNPANYWLDLEFFVWNGSTNVKIFGRQLGQAQYFTIAFTEAEINAMYTALGSATQGSGFFRLWTHANSSYDSQVGTYNDKAVTVYVDVAQKEAYITNTPNFVVGDNPTLQIHNPRNYWLRLEVLVWNGQDHGGSVATINMGQVASFTTAFTQAQINAIYARMKTITSASTLLRVHSYMDAGYTTPIGTFRDREVTVTIDVPSNVPTFTSFDLVSEDKAITVKDSYNNTLATTTTNTLTGSNQKVVKGVSQIKASITSANKMVAKNQADPVRYRLVSGEKLVEASYKASETVNLLMDNITSKDAVVSAYDSRGLSAPVSKSFTNIANYTVPTAWSLGFTRDNNVDEKTKLSIAGKFWKQYFGGGTSGVQNTITAHYRYKETAQSWGSQTWNTLAVTSNAEGDISFNDYINGDLGVNGFNKDKSYSIEVRFYDKISALIVQGTLNKGTPLLDWTIDGMAVKSKYDPVKGGSLQVDGENITTGWFGANEDWAYASSTTFTTAGDKRSKYQKGDKIKLVQSGNTKYFYIVGVAYSSPNTTITVTGGGDYSLTNAGITNPCFSKIGNPQGFPLSFSYTPALSVATGSLADASATGRFSIQGSLVVLTVSITITSKGSASGGLYFTIPVNNSTNSFIFAGRENASTGKMLQCLYKANNEMAMLDYINGSVIVDGYILRASGTYMMT